MSYCKILFFFLDDPFPLSDAPLLIFHKKDSQIGGFLSAHFPQMEIYGAVNKRLFFNDKCQVHQPVTLFSSHSNRGYSGFALWRDPDTCSSRNSQSSSFTRDSGRLIVGAEELHLNFRVLNAAW